MHKNKQNHTASNGVRASSFPVRILLSCLPLAHSFHLWRFKLEILRSQLPRGHPNKNWHSDELTTTKSDTADFYIFLVMLLFLTAEKLNLLDIHEECICKLGKIESKLKPLFGVYYWFLKLYTRIVWHSYSPLHVILLRKGSSRSGAKWVNSLVCWFWTCTLGFIQIVSVSNKKLSKQRKKKLKGRGLGKPEESNVSCLCLTCGFIVVDVDALQLQVGVPMVCTCGVDAMLVRDHFPELKKHIR